MPVHNTHKRAHTNTLSVTHTHKIHTSFKIRLCELQLEELSYSSEQRCTVERDLYLFYIPCKVYIDIVNVLRRIVKNANILTREGKKTGQSHFSSAAGCQWSKTGLRQEGKKTESIQEHELTQDSGWDFQDTCHFSQTE